MNEELINIIKEEGERFGISPVTLATFICVETGGKGFDSITNKILIQFEPI